MNSTDQSNFNKFYNKQKRITGIIPPLVTPFNDRGVMDEELLRKEVRYHLKAGVHGLSFGGSTGEGALLTAEEIERGITVLNEENHKKLPLICGIISNSTSDALEKGLVAKKAGADSLMVTPTYYHGTDDDGNFSYFKVLSDELNLPIIIYNVIERNPVSAKLMLQLAQIENVIGIKQSVGGLHAFNEMIAICGEQTGVYAAQDDLLFCSYLLGAAGAISAILSLFPELCVQQWDAIQSGNIEKAKNIHFRMYPVWRVVSVAGMSFPGRVKSILKILGRDCGLPRQPILEPSSEVINLLRLTLKQVQLIP